MSSGFDPDAWHAMQERDNQLIRDELLHGASSRAFVYEFPIQGKKVTGISVVGARELASQYKGIKSRIVATVEKRGALFIFRTFTPLSIETRHLPDLAEEDDFYECVMEVADIKTGNSIEVRKKENKHERKQDGTLYARPHFDVIAESKAFRNAVLAVLPQSVIQDFKTRSLAAGNSSAEATIQQRRAQATAHAAKHGFALDRSALERLTFDEITGLGNAAAQGKDQFFRSAVALGLVPGIDAASGEITSDRNQTQGKPEQTSEQTSEQKGKQKAEQKAADPSAPDSEGFGDHTPPAADAQPGETVRRVRRTVGSME